MTRPAQPSESMIHRAVAEQLHWRARPGVSWFHPANGEYRPTSTAGRLKALGVRPGVPDFVLIIAGRAHFLELKRERGGRLSPAQRIMHAELTAAGGVVETAHGLDAALEVLDVWGALKPSRRGCG